MRFLKKVFRFAKGVLLLPYFLLVSHIKHWYYKRVKKRRSPCKTYNKKKSIECYLLKFDKKKCCFTHYPFFRVKNPKQGEYYLIPTEAVQSKADRHYSYHQSGQFHWREGNGRMVKPLDGEADSRRARLVVQGMKYIFSEFDGYCIAVGSNVSIESLEVMLDILNGYILPPLDKIIDPQELLEIKTWMIPMPLLPQKKAALKLISVAVENKEYSEKSISEISNEKTIVLDPAPTGYITFSEELTLKLAELGRSVASEKLEAKPSAFWTKAPVSS